MTTILSYNGNGEGINGVPARDLYEADINDIAILWEISRDELISQLTSRGLYSLPMQRTKSKQSKPLDTEE